MQNVILEKLSDFRGQIIKCLSVSMSFYLLLRIDNLFIVLPFVVVIVSAFLLYHQTFIRV